MTVKLENLQALCADMTNNKETRTVFTFEYNTKPFSCIFLIDTSPYSLYITTFGESPITLEWNVDYTFELKGYIEPYLYRLLCKYLNLQYNPDNPFNPGIMLKVLNLNTPRQFKTKPTYYDVLKIASRTRTIEEKDKVFFCGWKSNPIGKNVSPLNLEKTKLAFGTKISELSKLKNISSCWTDKFNDERKKLFNEIYNH